MRSISILIPTLNSGRVLEQCLMSISEQDYPQELIELIVADGGSTDSTLDIARRYTDKIYPNPLKTGEAGKAVALKHASGEIVALIDSDNILPTPAWLRQMTEPFEDDEIVGTEPIEYTHRRQDGYITRYCALMGMNDPLCLFLGNYDRYNAISGKWTEMPVGVQDRGGYLKVMLDEKRLPTIGANGFLIRRARLATICFDSYFFDIDVVYELALQGAKHYAKVKTGIVHLFSGDLLSFARKQRRRITDYLHYDKAGMRKYPWGGLEMLRIARFIAYCVLVFPLLWQSVKGYLRRPDPAWLFHPLACWMTLWIYGTGSLRSLVRRSPYAREQWRQ